MFAKVVIICALADLILSDWVKLPQITNKPKMAYKIQSVTTLADLTSSSSLANSDVMSSVFSYDRQISTTTTTTKPSTTHAQRTSLKKYFTSTVTSKTVDFVHDISDRLDKDDLEMEPIKLVPTKKESRNILYMNQTVPMKVFVEAGKKLIDLPNTDDDDDEGVTVLDEDEELASSEEVEYYYEYEDEAETTSTTTTTTTRAPRRTTRRPTVLRPTSQRRISQSTQAKPQRQSNLSFSHFFKFIKNIQSSFTTRTAKNINDKIKMLREFRDNLLLTINQRIKTLWKTQAKTQKNKNQRSKRTLGGGDSGGWMEQGSGMAFPSAEGALLSISFLTFAVFLIKLVLQVIQTIKMKKYAYNNMQMTSTGDGIQTSNVVIKRHRAGRDVHYMNPDDLISTQFILSDKFVHFSPPMFHQHLNFPKLL